MTMLEKLGFDVADYWRERRVHVCGHFNWRHHAGITIEVWLCKCFLFFLVYIIHTYSSFPVEKNSDTKKFVSYMLKKSWRRSRIWSDDGTLEVQISSLLLNWVTSSSSHSTVLLAGYPRACIITVGHDGLVVFTQFFRCTNDHSYCTNKHGWCGRWVLDQCCSGQGGPSLL